MDYKEPNEDEIETAANILRKLSPGLLPFPIFHEIARLTATPIIEIVPFRHQGDFTEILLLTRDNDDPVWPNQLHTPGTVLRATDSLQIALQRVIEKELAKAHVSNPAFVSQIIHHSGRGTEAAQVYWIEVLSEIGVGEFYDAHHLPERLVRSQLDFIPQAVQDYESHLAKLPS